MYVDDSGHAEPAVPGGTAKDHARTKAPVIAYACLYTRLVVVAREHGYALAMHGSLISDCDIIAVPWVAEAADHAVLAQALSAASGGSLHLDSWPDRPHGLQKHKIHLGGGPYVDLCVVPRRETK